MLKIQYNPDVKILSIRFRKNKSVDSDIIDNVVLDFDKDGKLVNIDIMEVNLEDFVKVSDEIGKKQAISKK